MERHQYFADDVDAPWAPSHEFRLATIFLDELGEQSLPSLGLDRNGVFRIDIAERGGGGGLHNCRCAG